MYVTLKLLTLALDSSNAYEDRDVICICCHAEIPSLPTVSYPQHPAQGWACFLIPAAESSFVSLDFSVSTSPLQGSRFTGVGVQV